MLRSTRARLVALSLSLIAATATAQTASLELELLPASTQALLNKLIGWSIADVSDDGSTIIGRYTTSPGLGTPGGPVDFVWRPSDNPDLEPLPFKDGRLQVVRTDDDGQHLAFLGPSPTVLVYDRATDTLLYEASIPGVSIGPGGPAINTLNITTLSDDGKVFQGWWTHLFAFAQGTAFSFNSNLPAGQQFATKSIDYTGNNTVFSTISWQFLDANKAGSTVFGKLINGLTPLGGQSSPDYFVFVSDGINKVPLAHRFDGGVPVALTTEVFNTPMVAGRVIRPAGKGNIAALWLPGSKLPVNIALPQGGKTSQFYDINGNGEVAVGSYATTPNDVRALVWIKPRGSRDLAVVLAKFNVTAPANVALRAARFVSTDGTKIVGFAQDNAGGVYLYRATIPQSEVCYCNCDGSTGPDYLNAADLLCFQQRLAAKQFYTNADNSIGQNGKPTYNALDMSTFMQRFETGCPKD